MILIKVAYGMQMFTVKFKLYGKFLIGILTQ